MSAVAAEPRPSKRRVGPGTGLRSELTCPSRCSQSRGDELGTSRSPTLISYAATCRSIPSNPLVMTSRSLPGMALAEHVPLPELGEAGGPGPFSLADPPRIEDRFDAAGFDDSRVEERRALLKLPGSTPGEFELFLRALPVVQSILADADPETAERAVRAVLAVLEPRFGSEGLHLEGAAWLVTAARRP